MDKVELRATHDLTSHILATHTPYADLGSTYFDERERTSIERRLIRRLEKLGLKVSVEPLLPATDVA
jgi:hypothetical protein